MTECEQKFIPYPPLKEYSVHAFKISKSHILYCFQSVINKMLSCHNSENNLMLSQQGTGIRVQMNYITLS